jgi:prolyl 4-hydroxylase
MDYTAALPLLSFAPGPATTQDVAPSRTTLHVAGHAVLMVKDLLRPQECDDIVREAAKDGRMQPVNWEYVATYRRCTRSVTQSPVLAATIFQRLRPLLTLEDLDGVQPYGIGADGLCVLSFVNPCIRVSSYESGSGFQKHRDNGFVFSDDVRSIFTVVIYLNDGYTGGQTVFHSEGARLAVTPTKGSATIFNHDCLHEGATVESGCKLVLRADIMFQRIETIEALRFAYLGDARYQRAEELYQRSIQFQKAGDPAASTACFLEAMEIHAQLSSLRAKSRTEPDAALRTALSKDIWIEIALHLSLLECVALTRVNTYFKSVIRNSSLLWQTWFRRLWGVDGQVVLRICASLGDTATYYAALRSRYLADKNFRVACVDATSNFCATYNCAVSNQDTPALFSGRCGYGCGHLWGPGCSMFNTFVGPDMEVNEYDDEFYAIEKPYFSLLELEDRAAAIAEDRAAPLDKMVFFVFCFLMCKSLCDALYDRSLAITSGSGRVSSC